MIIVKFAGGLGNQMFQYALYRKLQQLGRDVYADRQFYSDIQSQTAIVRNYELDLFSLDIRDAKEQDREYMADLSPKLRNKVRRRIFGRRNSYYPENEQRIFMPQVLELEYAYLDGYWQSERYFADIREILVKEFQFPQKKENKNTEILKWIHKRESVALHIRRGDYLEKQNALLYGGICTLAYYEKAISYIKEQIKEPVFFVFSDDIRWAKENLQLGDAYFIDWNQGSDSYYDMYLMTQCRHNVIANSSFSWWGAWLNQHPDQMVISPSKWFQTRKAPDVISKNWIRM